MANNVFELAQNPRILTLISSVDGGAYVFKDDGGSREGFPGQLRQQLQNALAKRNKQNPSVPLFAFESLPEILPGEQISKDLELPRQLVDDAFRAQIARGNMSRAIVKAEAERSADAEIESFKKGAKK